MEAIVAFGLLALALTLALPSLTGSASRQAGRVQSLAASEFAVSVFEEYRATFPIMASTGQDASGWQWNISEVVIAPDGPTVLDTAMILVRLDLTARHKDMPDRDFQFSTIVARPRP